MIGCTMQRIAWVLLALLHLLPALAAVRPAMLTRLYGVTAADASYPLLQHRAALFGVVLVIALWAAFDPGVRRLASVAGALSMVSFLAIWWASGAPAALRPIAVADLIGLPILAYATWKAYG
jgi:hypothetical protein